jgi:hypothetical protein
MRDSASQDIKLWIIQRILETKNSETVEKIIRVLEDEEAKNRSKKNNRDVEILDELVGRAEDDIAHGRVHSHEAIGTWIDSLD